MKIAIIIFLLGLHVSALGQLKNETIDVINKIHRLLSQRDTVMIFISLPNLIAYNTLKNQSIQLIKDLNKQFF